METEYLDNIKAMKPKGSVIKICGFNIEKFLSKMMNKDI